MTAPYRPRIDLMIVGAQKCGTSALAQFLAAHPQIDMSSRKEVHLFDAPDYCGTWTAAEIDERYRPHFAHCGFSERKAGSLLGEATPIYLFFPDIAAELKRYSPALRLIVLLRDPVARAISHYYMEKGRGGEQRPLWLALLLEPFRLRRPPGPRHPESAARLHSYRTRGLYARQLRNLFRSFARDRVLILRHEDLLEHHDTVLRRVFGFLGVSTDARIPAEVVFEGQRGLRRHLLVSWVLRLSYLAERVRLRAVLKDGGDRPAGASGRCTDS